MIFRDCSSAKIGCRPACLRRDPAPRDAPGCRDEQRRDDERQCPARAQRLGKRRAFDEALDALDQARLAARGCQRTGTWASGESPAGHFGQAPRQGQPAPGAGNRPFVAQALGRSLPLPAGG